MDSLRWFANYYIHAAFGSVSPKEMRRSERIFASRGQLLLCEWQNSPSDRLGVMKKNVRLAQRGPPAARSRRDYLFQRWRISEKSRLRARIPRNQNNARESWNVTRVALFWIWSSNICAAAWRNLLLLILTLCLYLGGIPYHRHLANTNITKIILYPDRNFFDKIIATKIDLI